MKFLPKAIAKGAAFFCLVFFVSLLVLPSCVLALEPTATPTPTPSGLGQGTFPVGAGWVEDPVTTEVGRNSERARQLLFWVISHPPVYSAGVLAQLWSFTRNVVYGFTILVIVAFGLGLILSKRKGSIGPIFSGISSPVFGINIPSVFFKVITVLLYVTFSYVLVLGLIQIGEALMLFFIKFLGGADLFNIFFADQNAEGNYNFIGYRFYDPTLRNLEMINTSHFLIRLTSLTYNVMAAVLILRAVILWFFIVVSPFLAILMPFIFIRNTGWIWIGVFFQWLFYGPLFSLFLAALANIWKAGIPYPFDFTRVNKPGLVGQVYPTVINILYGGPAQTLSQTNSANYVDTYAEYVISLIMLWAVMFLPWLLLRIFRDYCCEIMASTQATIQSLFDRIRQYPLPPPPSGPPTGPTTAAGMAVELPFRQRLEEKVYEERKTTIESLKEISKVNTSDIARAMDLSVSSLSDVSRLEMNRLKQAEVKQRLDKIAAPERIVSSTERERFATLRSELKTRALRGDQQATSLLAATEKSKDSLATHVASFEATRAAMAAPYKTEGAFAPSIPTIIPASIPQVAKQTGVTESKVREVLAAIPAVGLSSTQVVREVAQNVGVTEKKAQEILSIARPSEVVLSMSMPEIAKQTGVTEGKVREVLAMIPSAGTPSGKVVTQVAQKTGMSTAQVQKILTTAKPLAPSVMAPTVSVEDYEEVKKMWLKHYRSAPVPVSEMIKTRQQWIGQEEKRITNISNLLASTDPKLKQKGLVELAEILPFMLLGGFSDAEILTYLKAKGEAASQIQMELEIEAKAKEEAKKTVAEEEELVEISTKKKEEKKKEAVLEQKRQMPLEDEKEKKDKEETLGKKQEEAQKRDEDIEDMKDKEDKEEELVEAEAGEKKEENQ